MITKNDIEKLVAENGAVIEKNTNWPNLESSGWKWKKYADGTVELWGLDSRSYAITTKTNDYWYRTVNTATISFPANLLSTVQICQVVKTGGTAYSFLSATTYNTSGVAVWGVANGSMTATIDAHIYVVGTWS